MRSLIKSLVVFLICLVGIGFYLGWFSLSKPSPDAGSNKVNANLSVDEGKMKSDVKKVEEKIKKMEGEVEAKVAK